MSRPALVETGFEKTSKVDRLAAPSKSNLKSEILKRLLAMGFQIREDSLVSPSLGTKDEIRVYHSQAVTHRLMTNLPWILRKEAKLMENFASGSEVEPRKISPVLRQVTSASDSDLFRYTTYTWSIPVSNGFGRRIRYLVLDQSNGKLIGLIGLTDPVIGLKVRDSWIGWTKQQREKSLVHVMDCHVLGAVPPYSYLLGGKLVALLATASEVRDDYRRKYAGRSTIISHRVADPELVLLTTTTALGPSSMLRRLKNRERLVWHEVGYTVGFGAFQFDSGLFEMMRGYLEGLGDPIVTHYSYGDGPNWRFRVLRRCLERLGVNQIVMTHGIRRGFYVAPLASNTNKYLLGAEQKPRYYDESADDIFAFFKSRYLLPRAERDKRYLSTKIEDIKVSLKAAKI